MEKSKPNYAKGIFLTKRKSKAGKQFLELSIAKGDRQYDKYLCFESDKSDQFGNQVFSIIVKEPLQDSNNKDVSKEDLPF